MHSPQSHRRVIRVLLAAGFTFLLRLAASGANPVDGSIKVSEVAETPATTAHVRLITKLIKATWTHSIKQSTEAPYGTVVVHLIFDHQGKVLNSGIVSGSPKEGLHRLALDAVNGTRLPAMPDDVIKELQGNHLIIDITFEFVPASNPVRKPSHH